jgi:hypothetical protein
MAAAFVLGNGVTRREVDLQNLRHFGPIYGCNALYRDFTPDVLVSTDRPISQRIQDSGYGLRHRHYTRKPEGGQGSHTVPQKYFGFSSGPIAAGIAAIDGATAIYLVGFDMAPINNRFNNVYADTEFYKRSSATPTYTGNWVRQLCTVMRDYPRTAFVRIMGTVTAEVEEFGREPNYNTMPMLEFLDRINNTKEL